MIDPRNLRKTTYRLYPTPKQALALDALLRSHQQLYNAALEERISAWTKAKLSISYEDQCKSLTVVRNDLPEWANIANCSSQQMTLRRLKKSFDAFFRRVKAGQTPGFPRFKSLDRFPGFSFKTHGDGWRFYPEDNWKHGTLRISGIGHIAARGKARQGGDIRASDVLHRNGQWFLSLTVQTKEPLRERTGNGALAFDWGVETFVSCITHDDEVISIENPRWWQADKDKIIELQRLVSSKRNKRSNRRKKAVAKLFQAKSKTARRRLNWLHHTSAQLAERFALVATEELNIKNMTRTASGTEEKPGKNVAQKAGLNREILDTAPALFTSLIRYKVQETGGEWLEAPTRKLKPSQRCPHCWNVQKKQLSQRAHECATCGHTESRDIASAKVVLRWALESEVDGREPRQYGGHFACRETPSFAQHRVG